MTFPPFRVWPLFRLIVAALVLTLGTAAVAADGKVLRRGNGSEPYSLDPHRTTGVWESHIIGDMLIGLYTEDVNAQPIFGAAQSAETSEDGLTWTFKIRPHTWSDGTPVSAEDFVFAYRRILDPKTAAQYANVLYPIKNAQKVNKGSLAVAQLGVKAPDASTLVIELEHPAPYLPQLLTHHTAAPLPRGLVQKVGNDWTKPGTMVSNGPYVLTEWRPHDHVKLVKNPKFYDATNVKIDEVFYYPIEDDLAALKRYRAGELDTNERWPLTEHKWLRENIPNEARTSTVLWVSYTSFNMTRKPFDDARVRRGLAMAIDRQAILNDVFFGAYGEEALTLLPPGTANVDLSAKVDWAGKPMEERKAEARKLLAAAGFGPEKPLKFTYNYINFPDNKRAAVAMQAMWKDVGAMAELSPTEPKVHYRLLETKSFDAAQDAWSFDYNDARNALFLWESTTIELNSSAYHSAAFDTLLQRADAEKDLSARGQLLGQATGILLKDLPAVPQFFPFYRPLVKSYVLNWMNNPRQINRTRWLDVGNRPGPGGTAENVGPGAEATEGGFWSWLGSWFSWDAWQKWWNS
jgi:oligopeptide transport system substrate-binding protein